MVLIKGQGIVFYPDEQILLAISRTVSLETPRGMRLAKEKSSHKIDVVVALAMAALAAVQEGQHVITVSRELLARALAMPPRRPLWANRRQVASFVGELDPWPSAKVFNE